VLELRGSQAIFCDYRPIVIPHIPSMSSQSKHWLDGKCHTFFDFSIKVLGVVMGDDQPGMEGGGNSMSSKVANYSVVETFGVGLNLA